MTSKTPREATRAVKQTAQVTELRSAYLWMMLLEPRFSPCLVVDSNFDLLRKNPPSRSSSRGK
jgi:hypothetical protein